jgi:hypothetical protein
MKTILRLLLVVLILMLSTACATITRGTKDTLVIETEPPTADATLSNGLRCKTPCSLKMSRSDNCVVKIEKEGYEPVEVNVTPQISGAGGVGMAGNVLIGGLIGAAVDAGTGAMYDLRPNPIMVKLEKKAVVPERAAIASAEPVIKEKTKVERLQELNELKEKGLIGEDDYLKQRDKILAEL